MRTICTILLFMILLFVTACNRLPSGWVYWPNENDRAVVTILVEEWERVRGPIADRCEWDLTHFRIAVLEDDAFRNQCVRCEPGLCPGFRISTECPWGCANGCFTRRRYGSPPQSIPLIVIHSSIVDRWNSMLVDEGIHMLQDCNQIPYWHDELDGQIVAAAKARLN